MTPHYRYAQKKNTKLTFLRSKNGCCCLWINFKVVELWDLTTLSQDHNNVKKAKRRKPKTTTGVTFCDALTATSTEKSVWMCRSGGIVM